MRRMLLAVPTAVALIGLPAAPADAQVERFAVFETPSEGCTIPAMDLVQPRCLSPRSPGEARRSACNLPVIYLGGTPGPCPEPKEPPSSRIIPLDLSRVSR